MTINFPIKTMMRSFFCALVATVTLSVCLLLSHSTYLPLDWSPITGYEPLPNWETCLVPSSLWTRLAFLRSRILPPHWCLRCTSFSCSLLAHVRLTTSSQGLYGAFVIKYNLQFQAFRRKHLGSSGITEAVCLAVLTASVGYLNMFLRIDMNESLDILFRECEDGGDYENLCQSVLPFSSWSLFIFPLNTSFMDWCVYESWNK